MSAKKDAPVSQIFLSCDLTGSTTFKQTPNLAEPWQKVFLQFYREFPQRVATTQITLGTKHLTFQLWKPVGDELIYSCKVLSEVDVYHAVRTWITAMQDYQKYSLHDTTMGTKGGAFIATFPGPDSRSSVPREPRSEDSDADVILLNRQALSRYAPSKYLYDYFGPSIDTGFRVLSKSTPRYFTLSVEVALAMIGQAKASGSGRRGIDVTDFLLLEFVELKGVWGGQPYPIVAIDTKHTDPVNKAYAKFQNRGDKDDLHDLCEACYNSKNWPSRMYLPNAINPDFKAEPADALANYVPTTSDAEKIVPDDPNAGELPPDVPLGPD